jgi:hypothetical protein
MRYSIDLESDCWNWKGAITSAGYAELGYRGRPELASRFVYTALIGAIPPGRHVCHRCDNPRCINPEHLFLGLPKDNISDAVKKGRWANRKLTFPQAEEIRARFASGENAPALGREFKVSYETIYQIVHRKSYLC